MNKDTIKHALEAAGQLIAWQFFGECRAHSKDAIAEPSHAAQLINEALAALSAEQQEEAQPCHKQANDYCKCSRKAMLCDGVGNAAPSSAAPDQPQARHPEETSQQNARFAIDGAIQYGRMGINPPPAADHWLAEYWNIGRKLAVTGEHIRAMPHGDNCFVSNHCESDPGNRCNCGKDSLLEWMEGGENVLPQEQPDDTKVTCPACTHQFRAIPVQVQQLMIGLGVEPPFTEALKLMDEVDALIRWASCNAPEPLYNASSAAFWQVCRMLAAAPVQPASKPELWMQKFDEERHFTTDPETAKVWLARCVSPYEVVAFARCATSKEADPTTAKSSAVRFDSDAAQEPTKCAFYGNPSGHAMFCPTRAGL